MKKTTLCCAIAVPDRRFSHVITGSKGWNLFHDLPWSGDHGDHDPAAMVEWWERWRGTVRTVWSLLYTRRRLNRRPWPLWWLVQGHFCRGIAFRRTKTVEIVHVKWHDAMMSKYLQKFRELLKLEWTCHAGIANFCICWGSRLLFILMFAIWLIPSALRVMISFFNWLCWNQCFLTTTKNQLQREVKPNYRAPYDTYQQISDTVWKRIHYHPSKMHWNAAEWILEWWLNSMIHLQ